MNKRQMDMAIKIIRKDATLKGRYIDEKGRMCVLGGMYHALGGLKRTLVRAGEESITRGSKATKSISSLIEKKLGLDMDDLCYLQDINDSYPEVRERRKRLIEHIREITE